MTARETLHDRHRDRITEVGGRDRLHCLQWSASDEIELPAAGR